MPNVQAKRDTCFVWVCKREGASSQSSWSACAEATKAAEALSPLGLWHIQRKAILIAIVARFALCGRPRTLIFRATHVKMRREPAN